MSRPRSPDPNSLAVGILLAREIGLTEVIEALSGALGRPSEITPEFLFDESRYYEKEMGAGLRRIFVGLDGLWDPGELASIKERSNELEERWATSSGRRVNLDPGMVGLNHFVLASAKPAAHRVYLARGIHAELEYLYERGSFRPLPWTYPDYRKPPVLTFFNRLRDIHKKARKGIR